MPPRLEHVTIVHDDGEPTAIVILDRPARLNALSNPLLRELVAVSDWLSNTREIKAVVVCGADGNFSAGFDLDDFTATRRAMPRDTADLGRVAADALTNTRPITIAAIDGHCVGGGVVLAASCDLRLASKRARFSIPEVDLGIPLAWGGIPRLARELGPAVTKELVLTCRPFDATEAHSLRFVNRVIDGDVIAAATALAAQLATKPAFALESTKRHVDAVMEEIAGTGRNHSDADTLAVALADPESREIAAAYLARRGRSSARRTADRSDTDPRGQSSETS